MQLCYLRYVSVEPVLIDLGLLAHLADFGSRYIWYVSSVMDITGMGWLLRSVQQRTACIYLVGLQQLHPHTAVVGWDIVTC